MHIISTVEGIQYCGGNHKHFEYYLYSACGSLHSIDSTPPHNWWCSSTELLVFPTVLMVPYTVLTTLNSYDGNINLFTF